MTSIQYFWQSYELLNSCYEVLNWATICALAANLQKVDFLLRNKPRVLYWRPANFQRKWTISDFMAIFQNSLNSFDEILCRDVGTSHRISGHSGIDKIN